MGSASSRDTHDTDCSFPAGGRNPTFCQEERVCHRGPGCLPALPPLLRVRGEQLSVLGLLSLQMVQRGLPLWAGIYKGTHTPTPRLLSF